MRSASDVPADVGRVKHYVDKHYDAVGETNGPAMKVTIGDGRLSVDVAKVNGIVIEATGVDEQISNCGDVGDEG